MIEVFRAANELQGFCVQQNWSFCFIGGIALQRWGEPRLTVDADLTLLTGYGDESAYIDPLLTCFQSRIKNARDFALANRILLLKSDTGVAFDIALGGLPFEASACKRASDYTFPDNITLRTCSAEDLIVMKAFAMRPKDWMDVDGILMRQARVIDWAYVLFQLRPLSELKDAPEMLSELQARREKYSR